MYHQYCIDKATPVPEGLVPVGYACEDLEVLLLDETGAEVGGHDIGEVVVKSRYLSPGYWRQPALTNAVFLPDPAGSSARLYRTGDLGRRQPDGCLLYLGRKDLQVKVRGHRIEVAEVELALLEHPAVKEVVVVARQDQPDTTRLVAYLVVRTQPAPSSSALRHFLTEKLPDYMVPSAFVTLETLPLTPNNKVDRQALPAPDQARPELANPFTAPRTPIEAGLVHLWAEVLSLDAVGIHDSFLELGGDSLLATQIIARVINTWRVALPVRTLLEAPTVADMAFVIAQRQLEEATPEDIEHMLTELEALSAAQVQQRLSAQHVYSAGHRGGYNE